MGTKWRQCYGHPVGKKRLPDANEKDPENVRLSENTDGIYLGDRVKSVLIRL